jgi:hypothetical protein
MRCRRLITWTLGLSSALGIAAAPDQPVVLVPSTVLAFDADLKQPDTTAATTNLTVTFWVTNVCSTNVLILGVSSSCGCTVARLPGQPWLLQPLQYGPIRVTLDLRGRRGTVLKGVQVESSAGLKALVVRAQAPAAPSPGTVPTNAPATPDSQVADPPQP